MLLYNKKNIMAKSKTIKLRGKKKITYKTIPQLAKILNKTKAETRVLVRKEKKDRI